MDIDRDLRREFREFKTEMEDRVRRLEKAASKRAEPVKVAPMAAKEVRAPSSGAGGSRDEPASAKKS